MLSVFKWVCTIGFVAITGFWGFLEARRLTLRVKTLEGVIQFLKTMESEIAFASYPIGDIIVQHREELPFLSECLKNLQCGYNFKDSWSKAIWKDKSWGGLGKEDKAYLEKFGDTFGGVDKTGQIANCQLAITYLEQQLEKAREDVTKKSKLYRSLGVLCGGGILLIIV